MTPKDFFSMGVTVGLVAPRGKAVEWNRILLDRLPDAEDNGGVLIAIAEDSISFDEQWEAIPMAGTFKTIWLVDGSEDLKQLPKHRKKNGFFFVIKPDEATVQTADHLHLAPQCTIEEFAAWLSSGLSEANTLMHAEERLEYMKDEKAELVRKLRDLETVGKEFEESVLFAERPVHKKLQGTAVWAAVTTVISAPLLGLFLWSVMNPVRAGELFSRIASMIGR